jgi:hypothetical protein
MRLEHPQRVMDHVNLSLEDLVAMSVHSSLPQLG